MLLLKKKKSFELRFKTFSQSNIPKIPENRGNRSDYFKTWLFCSVWNIWYYQWLQAIKN